MQVLIAYPFVDEIRDLSHITYLPSISQDESRLCEAIATYHPHVIIVGNNLVSSKAFDIWRSTMHGEYPLALIRRGSSLSRIDVQYAKCHRIDVYNTLGVNSRFVAVYMIKHLQLGTNKKDIMVAIIGSGGIGQRIGDQLDKNGYRVTVFSPSLKTPDSDELKRIRQRKGLGSESIQIACSAEDAVRNATHIVLAIDADRVLDIDQKLSTKFIQSIPNNARIVSVTEFRVFADGALELLIERIRQGELSARLDSHAFDIKTVKNIPDKLELASEAMTERGCGEAMDQAALLVLSNIILEKTFEKSLKGLSIRPMEEILIVGCGILGLVTGFILSENGYRVIFVDEHSHSENSDHHTVSSMSGVTLDGCDARHGSVTETVPHALFYRKDSLIRSPNNRSGWKILPNNFTKEERVWIERFSELCVYPELTVNLITRFVANLNQAGIQLWQDLFRRYPTVFSQLREQDRLIRLGTPPIPSNTIRQFQEKFHPINQIKELSREEILHKLPGLNVSNMEHMIAVEVPGFTVNVRQLTSSLIRYLKERPNVQFHWSRTLSSIDDLRVYRESASRIVFASSFPRVPSNLFRNIDLSIQGVAGCWTQIKNIHNIKEGFKIHEKDPLGVMNVTPSANGNLLHITGGFGYCGKQGVIFSPLAQQLVDLFKKAVRFYFPHVTKDESSDDLCVQMCVRPMTPDGMPILSQLNNDPNPFSAPVYFIGGTNAGGFVQAPVLAVLLQDLFQNSNQESVYNHIYRSLHSDRQTLKFELQ